MKMIASARSEDAAEERRDREALLAGRGLLVAVIEAAQKDALRCIELTGRPNAAARAAREWVMAETDPRLETPHHQVAFDFAPAPRSRVLTFDGCCAELENWYPTWFGDWEALRRRMLARIDAAWMYYRMSVALGMAGELRWPERARPDDPQDLRLVVEARARRLLRTIERRHAHVKIVDLPLFAAVDRECKSELCVGAGERA